MQPLWGLSPGPADKTSCVSSTLFPIVRHEVVRCITSLQGGPRTLPNTQGIGSNTALPGTEAKPRLSPAREAACLESGVQLMSCWVQSIFPSLLSSSFLRPPFLLPAPNTCGRIAFTMGFAVYNLLWSRPCSCGKMCLVLPILQTRELQLRDMIPCSRFHSVARLTHYWTWAHNWFHKTAV